MTFSDDELDRIFWDAATIKENGLPYIEDYAADGRDVLIDCSGGRSINLAAGLRAVARAAVEQVK